VRDQAGDADVFGCRVELLPVFELVALSNDEADRLAQFSDEARLLRYPTTTPAKARFEQVDG
jgi:hypothetical protein